MGAWLTWESVWKIGSMLLDFAREMAVGEGLTAEEYDRRVAELEASRAEAAAAIIARLKALLS